LWSPDIKRATREIVFQAVELTLGGVGRAAPAWDGDVVSK
jgi:hypothetical protein